MTRAEKDKAIGEAMDKGGSAAVMKLRRKWKKEAAEKKRKIEKGGTPKSRDSRSDLAVSRTKKNIDKGRSAALNTLLTVVPGGFIVKGARFAGKVFKTRKAAEEAAKKLKSPKAVAKAAPKAVAKPKPKAAPKAVAKPAPKAVAKPKPKAAPKAVAKPPAVRKPTSPIPRTERPKRPPPKGSTSSPKTPPRKGRRPNPLAAIPTAIANTPTPKPPKKRAKDEVFDTDLVATASKKLKKPKKPSSNIDNDFFDTPSGVTKKKSNASKKRDKTQGGRFKHYDSDFARKYDIMYRTNKDPDYGIAGPKSEEDISGGYTGGQVKKLKKGGRPSSKVKRRCGFMGKGAGCAKRGY